MHIKYLLTILLLLTSLEAKPKVLTLDNLVKIALQHSPDIDISRFNFQKAQERAAFSQGYYLPSLDLHLSGGRQKNEFKDYNNQYAHILLGSIGASQLLYDFGKTSGKVDSSINETLALQAQMQQVISDKILNIKQNYYDILKTKSIIDVQYKNVKLQKQQLWRAKKYLLAGIRTIIDVTNAKVQLEQAQLDLLNAKFKLELQRAKLEETLGMMPYDGKYKLFSKKLSLPKISNTLPLMKTSLHQLEEFAYRHRYVLQSSQYSVSSARSHVKTKRGDYAPTITLNGEYTTQYVDHSIRLFTPENQAKVTVNMNWNLYRGFQTNANVQESKVAVLQASSRVQSVRLAVKLEVVEAHISLRRNKNNVKLSESISKSSSQKFLQAKKRYENGISDYIELQDAQQGYIKSLSDLVNTYYDYFIAMAQLDNAIGK